MKSRIRLVLLCFTLLLWSRVAQVNSKIQQLGDRAIFHTLKPRSFDFDLRIATPPLSHLDAENCGAACETSVYC